MEQTSFVFDVYPNHGASRQQNQYDPWKRRLEAFEYEALTSRGFERIEDLSLASGGYAESDTFKRADSMGRVVYITPHVGRWRVTHSYLDHKISSTFSLAQQYALDILAGRDNEWLFLGYPKEDNVSEDNDVQERMGDVSDE